RCSCALPAGPRCLAPPMRRSHAVNKYEGFITIRCVCLQMIARYVPHCALIELQRRIEWQGCGFAAQGSATGHAQALPGNKTYQPTTKRESLVPRSTQG